MRVFSTVIAFLFVAAPAFAQPPLRVNPSYPAGVSAPIFIVPAAGVNGSGTVTSTLCFDASNPDVGIKRASANTLGVTNCGATTYLTLGSAGIAVPNSSASAPSIAFLNDTHTGFFRSSGGFLGVTQNSVSALAFGANAIKLASGALVAWTDSGSDPAGGTNDTILARDAANHLAQRNSTNVQSFSLGALTTPTTLTTLDFLFPGNGFVAGQEGAGGEFNFGWNAYYNSGWKYRLTDTAARACYNCISAGAWSLAVANSGSANAAITWAEQFRVNSSGAILPTALITAPTQAAGGTVNNIGSLNRQRYLITVSPAAGDCSTAFNAAALTADCTIGTMPAGMKLVSVYADVTAAVTCSATCSGTKVMQAGTSAGGTEILAAGLNVAATATYGLADADLGSGMTRAAAIQGGLIGSWSTTTPISVRFTSGTGNWGTGAATNVNAGTIKFYLTTEQIK